MPKAVHVKHASAKDRMICYQCTADLMLASCRKHVGRHILRSSRMIAETTLKEQVHINCLLIHHHPYLELQVSPTQHTCGFCAQNECNIELIPADKGSFKIVSNCQHSYASIKFKSASDFTTSDPCTNVLICCLLCHPDSKTGRQPVFWCYNMDIYLHKDHPTRDISSIPWKMKS